MGRIDGFHSQLDETLTILEDQVDQLFEAHSNCPPTNADLDREEIWLLGAALESKLQSLGEAIDRARGNMRIDPGVFESQDIGQMVATMQENEEMRIDLQGQGEKLGNDLEKLEQSFYSTGM